MDASGWPAGDEPDRIGQVPADSTGLGRKGWAIICCGLLLTLLVAGGAALLAAESRKTEIDEWRESLSNLSATVAEHARQSFNGADLVLRNVVERVQGPTFEYAADFHRAMASRSTFDMLTQHAAGVPQ